MLLWTLGSFFGNVMEHFLFPIATTDLFCWIFTTQGLKKSSAIHTKDSCEKNVPKLPEFKECFFWNCSLCVTVNSVKCLVFHSIRVFTLCYCELWVHSFENLKHFLFELLVNLGNECYGTFSYKPFASRLQSSSNQCFEHRLTMHLVVGGHLWSVLHIFCHKTEVKMHILFGNQGLCQALNLFFIKTRSGSHPWTTTTDQRRK